MFIVLATLSVIFLLVLAWISSKNRRMSLLSLSALFLVILILILFFIGSQLFVIFLTFIPIIVLLNIRFFLQISPREFEFENPHALVKFTMAVSLLITSLIISLLLIKNSNWKNDFVEHVSKRGVPGFEMLIFENYGFFIVLLPVITILFFILIKFSGHNKQDNY